MSEPRLSFIGNFCNHISRVLDLVSSTPMFLVLRVKLLSWIFFSFLPEKCITKPIAKQCDIERDIFSDEKRMRAQII